MKDAILVFIGGGLGSVARFGISGLTLRHIQTNFPVGTFLANFFACIILAIAIALLSQYENKMQWLKPLMIIGFCGGFSTFSTFSFETLMLFRSGYTAWGISNIIVSVLSCIIILFFLYKPDIPQ